MNGRKHLQYLKMQKGLIKKVQSTKTIPQQIMKIDTEHYKKRIKMTEMRRKRLTRR